MGGGSALVVMPTGSGKSLCFQLPALAMEPEGVTLVFSPLIALMEDQVAALKAKGIRAEYINSTLGRRERERRCKRLAEGRYDLIYATPERMQKPEFLEALDARPGGVKLLAVDEAHCISRWGHDLRPAYQRVGRFRKRLGNPVTIALTATATKHVRQDIRRTLGLDQRRMPLFAAEVDRPNLSLEVTPVWGDDAKIEHIRKVLAVRRGKGTGIVYFARITELDRFADELRPLVRPRPVEIYHGRLSARMKKQVYRRFISAEPDEGLLLLATNAFGMGVDKPDIRFIIHAQVPGSVEAYFQEVGRAGRDGKRSRCVLLYAQDDLAIQQQFIEWANPSADTLVRVAHLIEDSPHPDLDVEELQVMASGKSRSMHRGHLEHVLIALAKRGVIEPAGTIGRYRLARPIEHGEVDPAAIERKKQRDLKRLLDILNLVKCRDVTAFIAKYFDLTEDPPPAPRRGRKKRRRGKKKAPAPAGTAEQPDGTPRRRRRRRRRKR